MSLNSSRRHSLFGKQTQLIEFVFFCESVVAIVFEVLLGKLKQRGKIRKRYVTHYSPLVDWLLLLLYGIRRELAAKTADFEAVRLLFIFADTLQCLQFDGKTMTIPAGLILHITSSKSNHLWISHPESNLCRLIISFRIYAHRNRKTRNTLFSKWPICKSPFA